MEGKQTFKVRVVETFNDNEPQQCGGRLITTTPCVDAIRASIEEMDEIVQIYWWDREKEGWRSIDGLQNPVADGIVFQAVKKHDPLGDAYQVVSKWCRRGVLHLSASTAPFKPVHRELFFDAFADHFIQIASGHQLLSPADSTPSNFSFPYAATQGGPGSGKSFALDAIASKSEEFMACLRAKNVMAAELFEKSVVAIPVTFNGPQDSSLMPVRVKSWSYGARLALRMLHSFFHPNMSFPGFVLDLYSRKIDVATLNATKAMTLIVKHLEMINHPSPIVVLLVDEILNVVLFRESVDLVMQDILREINAFLSSPHVATDVIVSSRDPSIFKKFTASLNRTWDWLPLHPLHKDVDQLFDVAKYPIFASPAFKSAVVECSGHPKTLEDLYSFAVKCPPGYFPPFEFFVRLLVSKWIMRPTVHMLLPVILNQTINVHDKLTDSWPVTMSCKELASQSYYLNSLKPNDLCFLPRMSTVLMRQFVGHFINSYDEFARSVAVVLDQLFAAADSMSPSAFEQFHAEFELLRRLFVRGETTLSKQYPGALSFGFDPDSVRFTLSGTNTCVLNENFAQSTTHDGVLSDENVIFTYPHANPGFNATLMQKSGDKRILLCWETRMSDPAENASTVQTAAEVASKWDLTAQAVRDAANAAGDSFPEDDVYLIIIAYWKVPEYTKISAANLPKNTMIVPHVALEKLYGSFTSRLSFRADAIEQRLAQQERRNQVKKNPQARGSQREIESALLSPHKKARIVRDEQDEELPASAEGGITTPPISTDRA